MVVVPPAKAALVPEFRSSAKSSPRKLVQGSMPPGIINFSVASMTFAPEKINYKICYSFFVYCRIIETNSCCKFCCDVYTLM